MDDIDDELENINVASNGVYSFLVTLLSVVMSFILSVFIGRFLGASLYGVYSLSIIIWSSVTTIASLGFGGMLQYGVSKYRANNKKDVIKWLLEHYFWVLLLASTVSSVALFALSGPLAVLFHAPQLSYLIQILAVGVVFFSVTNNFAYPILTGLQKIKYSFVSNVIFEVIGVGQIVALFYGFGLVGLVGFYDLSFVGAAIFSLYIIYHYLKPIQHKKEPDRRGRSHLKKYGHFTYGMSLIGLLYNYFIILFLGVVAPNTEFVGFYRVGHIMGSFIAAPAMAIGSGFFATATKFFERGELDKFYRLQYTLMRYAALITIPLALGSIVAINPLIRLLYRGVFLGAQTPFIIITVSSLIVAIFAPITIVLGAIGKQKYNLYSAVISAVVSITIVALAVPNLLSTGGALALFGVNISNLLVNIFFSKRYIKIVIPYKEILKMVVAGAIMSGILYFLLEIFTSLILLPFILIMVFFFYLLITFFMGVLHRRDIVFFLKFSRQDWLLRLLRRG